MNTLKDGVLNVVRSNLTESQKENTIHALFSGDLCFGGDAKISTSDQEVICIEIVDGDETTKTLFQFHADKVKLHGINEIRGKNAALYTRYNAGVLEETYVHDQQTDELITLKHDGSTSTESLSRFLNASDITKQEDPTLDLFKSWLEIHLTIWKNTDQRHCSVDRFGRNSSSYLPFLPWLEIFSAIKGYKLEKTNRGHKLRW